MSLRAFLSLKEDISQGRGCCRAWARPGKGTAWQYTTTADSSGATCEASLACRSHRGIRTTSSHLRVRRAPAPLALWGLQGYGGYQSDGEPEAMETSKVMETPKRWTSQDVRDPKEMETLRSWTAQGNGELEVMQTSRWWRP